MFTLGLGLVTRHRVFMLGFGESLDSVLTLGIGGITKQCFHTGFGGSLDSVFTLGFGGSLYIV